MRLQPIASLVLFALLPTPVLAQQPLHFERATSGALGDVLQFAYSGLPQPLLVLIASDAAGATPLPTTISSRPLDIGPNLLLLPEVAPTANGVTTAVPVPFDLSLTGLRLHWQAAALPGTTTLFDALSARVVTQLTQPLMPTLLPAVAAGKAWAARIHRADAAGGPGTWLFAGGALRPSTEQLPVTTTDVFDALTLEVHAGPQLPDDVYAMTCTALLDGTTLLTGGVTQLPVPQVPTPQDATAGAVLYDPVGDDFLSLPPMSLPRFLHAAARLPDGRVVVVGGTASANLAAPMPLASSEVFDPITRTWSPGPSLPAPWFWGALSTLPNGDLLLHGGLELTAFGLLPATTCRRLVMTSPGVLTWQPAAPMGNPRLAHERGTLLLADGRLLVAGGCAAGLYAGQPALVATAAVETYDTGTDTWTPHTAAPITFFSGTLDQMPNGTVVATGGMSGLLSTAPVAVQPLAQVMVWDPIADGWQSLFGMQQPRMMHGAVVGQDGALTLIGGHVVAAPGPGNTTVERLVP